MPNRQPARSKALRATEWKPTRLAGCVLRFIGCATFLVANIRRYTPRHMEETPQEAPATARPKPPLWKRVRGWALILAIYSVVLGLAYGGIHFLLRAFQSGSLLDDRIYDAILATAMLALPARIFWVMLGTRLSTGRWTKPPQERRQRVAQCAAKRSGVTQPSGWAWAIHWFKWANFKARQAETAPIQRLAARALLLLGLLGYLVACLFPLICVGAAFADDNTRVATVVFLAMAPLFAIIPWMLTRSLLRYRSTHPFMRTQPEELGEIGARHTQWHIQESQKPLKTKIITTVLTVAGLGFWWLRATVFHAHHPHESWTTPAMYTPFALYAVLIQFRKPKVLQAPAQETQSH